MGIVALTGNQRTQFDRLAEEGSVPPRFVRATLAGTVTIDDGLVHNQ